MRMRLLSAVLAAGLWGSPIEAAPILSVQPAAATVDVGQVFSLDIVVTGAVDLYAFQFDLGFNPTVIAGTSVSEGPFLATGGPTFFIAGSIDNAGGLISFTASTLLSAVPGVIGSGILATIQFSGLAPGVSPVNLFGVTLLDSTFAGIDVTNVGGTVTAVSAAASVPEPATLALLAGGMLALGRRMRYRRPCDSPERRAVAAAQPLADAGSPGRTHE